jgi:hypothetical protein
MLCEEDPTVIKTSRIGALAEECGHPHFENFL